MIVRWDLMGPALLRVGRMRRFGCIRSLVSRRRWRMIGRRCGNIISFGDVSTSRLALTVDPSLFFLASFIDPTNPNSSCLHPTSHLDSLLTNCHTSTRGPTMICVSSVSVQLPQCDLLPDCSRLSESPSLPPVLFSPYVMDTARVLL